jgi:mRNA (guanine-N7-)-methyltransferase
MKNRHQSFYYNLRKYHNWIKRQLINKYASKTNKLLDLASGKGGDLQKWQDARIKVVRGYDIDAPSINEANRRLAQSNVIPEMNHSSNVTFTVKDLSINVLDSPIQTFDVVTSMFAFHYFFQTQDTFETILASIENNLKVDGYFMCCMFDGETTEDKINNGSFLSTNFKLRQKNSTEFSKMSPFGKRISVLMKETVLDTETDEYLVNFSEFFNMMKWRGFQLVESRMFSELYSTWSSENPRNNMNSFEKEVSFLNRYYVFKRVSNLDEQLKCFHQIIE